MQAIFPNTPRALKLYASFLIEILNDKDGGNELLLKAKDASSVKNQFDMSGTTDELSLGGGSLN